MLYNPFLCSKYIDTVETSMLFRSSLEIRSLDVIITSRLTFSDVNILEAKKQDDKVLLATYIFVRYEESQAVFL